MKKYVKLYNYILNLNNMIGVEESAGRMILFQSPSRSVIGGTFPSILVSTGKKSSTLKLHTDNPP